MMVNYLEDASYNEMSWETYLENSVEEKQFVEKKECLDPRVSWTSSKKSFW